MPFSIKSNMKKLLILPFVTLLLLLTFSVTSYAATIQVDKVGKRIIVKDLGKLTDYPGTSYYAAVSFDLSNLADVPSNAKVKSIMLDGEYGPGRFGGITTGIYSYQKDKRYFTFMGLLPVQNLDPDLNARQQWKLLFGIDNFYDGARSGTWDPYVTIYYN